MKKLLFLSALALFTTATLCAQEVEVKKKVKIITIDDNGKQVIREYENGDQDVIEWSTTADDQVKIIVRKDGEEEEIIVGNMPSKIKWHMVKGSNRGFLGVYLSDNKSEINGAVVSGVVEGAPAQEGGLQEGDVITAVADRKVIDNESLLDALSAYDIGEKVSITYLRDGAEKKANIVLGKRAEEDILFEMPDFEKEMIIDLDEAGMHYSQVFNEDKAFLGIEPANEVDDVAGVMVMKTTQNSAAHKAGLQTGDIITALDGKAISDFQDLVDALSTKKPGDEVVIKYNRQGKKKSAKVTLTSMAEVMKIGDKRIIIKERDED